MIAQGSVDFVSARSGALAHLDHVDTGNPKVASADARAPPCYAAAAGHQGRLCRALPQTWKLLRALQLPAGRALEICPRERNFERGLNPAGVGRHSALSSPQEPQGAAGQSVPD